MDDQTHPVINIEETIGKTVGKRRDVAKSLRVKEDSKAAAEAWRKALPAGGIPKGVYKFKSHEEADEWLIKMMARAAAERS
jgi:hypothetical protein